jgi:hypothetical protein
MAIINRNVVLVSPLVVAAVAVAFAISGPGAVNSPAADQVAQRFPLASEMLMPVPLTTYIAPKLIAAQKAAATRTPRPTRVQLCAATPNGWPYVTHECLVG